MIGALRQRVEESFRSFAQVFENPDIRKIELAWSGSVLGHWAYGIALAVYAYQEGGAAAVGLVGLIRFLPPAIVGPFTAMLADRFRRERVMVVADLTRAVLLGAAALMIAIDGPPAAVYALAGLVSVAYSALRPAQAALLPSLARSPAELTSANVASSTIESIGVFGGPALGGILLAATSASVVFAVAAAGFVYSALLVSRVAPQPPPEGRTQCPDSRLGAAVARPRRAGCRLPDLGARHRGRARRRRRDRARRPGAPDVGLQDRDRAVGPSDRDHGTVAGTDPGLPAPDDRRDGEHARRRLRVHAPSAGGAGRGAGAGVRRRAEPLGGGDRPRLDPRAARDRADRDRGRADRHGLDSAGARRAALAPDERLDRAAVVPERELELLRGIELFRPLPPPILEGLAGAMTPMRVEAGREIVREGEAGDRFYVISSGQVEVVRDGQVMNEEGPGEYFGEIALLRDVPRTATVRAKTDVDLRALERDDFIGAVTGHAASAEAADSVVATRLGSLRPGLASV